VVYLGRMQKTGKDRLKKMKRETELPAKINLTTQKIFFQKKKMNGEGAGNKNSKCRKEEGNYKGRKKSGTGLGNKRGGDLYEGRA